MTTSATENSIGVKAVVITQQSDELNELELTELELTLQLQFVSATGLGRPPIQVTVSRSSADGNEVENADENADGNEVKYETEFSVKEDFGEIGAVFVQHQHNNEVYLKTIEIIALDCFPIDPVHITCNSYVQPTSDGSDRRIFFSNKSYLPCQTPSGLKLLRKEELENLRGNGEGERTRTDRIYDYDVYNDLSYRDNTDPIFVRPVLGGNEHPYPRRCRTGRSRPKDIADAFYVPRDEAFSGEKEKAFSVPGQIFEALKKIALGQDHEFQFFTARDSLYHRENALPRMIESDNFSWLSDEEFSRQTLAGINPCTIELVKEWPLKSKLDPQIYGPPESAITKERVEREIGGFMSLEEALEKKRLFMLDYHDLLLPYVNKVRELDMTTTLYRSRTLFFLTPDGTLRPLAIELTKPQWKQVFTPDWTATGCWLWRLAKAHVLAHDSAIHQLVSHWLRTHCCVEPYVIATNRQLSAMHPIYRLLHPHLRYTIQINAKSRQLLISANGIIESTFSPGKYSMELSSVAYAQQWRFDLQALPADLISRGMAVENPRELPHGLKLVIKDYPFANDGLLLWDAIKQWVTEYVSHYYLNASAVKSDDELQDWWTEIKTKGHKDKEEGWPELETPKDLIGILTTMIWVASGHHAAVNFGQYDYAGYAPNRPTIARKKMPTEEPTAEELKSFLKKPADTLLKCFPSKDQASVVKGILGVLSHHSPDEEYLGDKIKAAWNEEPAIKEAFERFNRKLMEIEEIIDHRNKDINLNNRSGAGVMPYELLKPFSEPGVTGKGVPNSISM